MKYVLAFLKGFGSLIVSLFMSLCYSASLAQNFVPNGSFELYNHCPGTGGAVLGGNPSLSTLPWVQNWESLTQGVEWFNSCATSSRSSVPSNIYGYQPARTGNAYAAILTYGTWGLYSRDYPSVRLSSALVKDSAYCVRFFVNLATQINSGAELVGVSEIGAHFSKTRIYPANLGPLNVPYHIRNDSTRFLTDTVNWMEVFGVYVADGGEEYITIGCFGTNPPTYTHVAGTVAGVPVANYYLDDVSVSPARRKDAVYYINKCETALIQSSTQTGPWLWSNGATTQSINVDSSGTYVCRTRSTTNNCEVFYERYVVTIRRTQYDTTRTEMMLCAKQATITSARPKGPYQWSTGDTTRSIKVVSTGDYMCSIGGDCAVSTEVFRLLLDTIAVPDPVVRDTTICRYIVAPVLAVSDTGLLWYTAGFGGTGDTAQPIVNTEQAGKITLYVAAKSGYCLSKRVPLNIEIKGAPKSSPADTVVRCKTPYPNPQPLGQALEPDVSYSWNRGESSCCIYVYQDATYTRLASNICGSSTDTFLLQSENCENCVLFPDAFTPNNDGLNDGFKALVRCHVQWSGLHVYNKWGELVFATNDPDAAWDGKHKGINAPAGVYMYFATFFSKYKQFTKRQVVKGEVTLIR